MSPVWPRPAAAQLEIHGNTLDYRLRAIEDALGYAVRLGNGVFKLQLALKRLPLAGTPWLVAGIIGTATLRSR